MGLHLFCTVSYLWKCYLVVAFNQEKALGTFSMIVKLQTSRGFVSSSPGHWSPHCHSQHLDTESWRDSDPQNIAPKRASTIRPHQHWSLYACSNLQSPYLHCGGIVSSRAITTYKCDHVCNLPSQATLLPDCFLTRKKLWSHAEDFVLLVGWKLKAF